MRTPIEKTILQNSIENLDKWHNAIDSGQPLQLDVKVELLDFLSICKKAETAKLQRLNNAIKESGAKY